MAAFVSKRESLLQVHHKYSTDMFKLMKLWLGHSFLISCTFFLQERPSLGEYFYEVIFQSRKGQLIKTLQRLNNIFFCLCKPSYSFKSLFPKTHAGIEWAGKQSWTTKLLHVKLWRVPGTTHSRSKNGLTTYSVVFFFRYSSSSTRE